MNRTIANILGCSLIALVALTGVGGYLVYPHVTALLDRYQQAAPSAGKADAVLDNVNATVSALNGPCKDFQGDYICPPLTQLSQTEKNIGILAGRSAQQVQQTGTLVTAVAHNLDTVGDSVKTVADKLSGAATAATGTLEQAQTDLATLDGSIAATKPLLSHADAAVSDLDAILADNRTHIASTLANVDGMTGNLNGIAADGRKVSDKLTADFVTPKRWYQNIGPKLGDVFDYGALAARHVP
jgi:hypothetical protein